MQYAMRSECHYVGDAGLAMSVLAISVAPCSIVYYNIAIQMMIY